MEAAFLELYLITTGNQTQDGAMEENAGMLTMRRSRPEEPRAGSSGEGVASPLLISYGIWGGAVSSPGVVRCGAQENIEFGAFWDLRIASKQCNVARKLHERVQKYGVLSIFNIVRILFHNVYTVMPPSHPN